MACESPARNTICIVGIENLPLLAPEFRGNGVGGAQLQQTLLARALAQNGFKVSMIVADLGQADEAVWDQITTYKAYRMDAGIRGLRLLHPRATSVWAAMKRANAQIYYTSCADYLTGVVAFFASRFHRRSVFRVAHDTDCQPDKLLIPNRRSKAIYNYGIRHTDLILAQSTGQQADLLRNYKRQSVVVPSLAQLSATALDLEARDIQLLWVGNMRPFKRPDLALALAASMPDLSLRIVGGADPQFPEYFSELKARAGDLPNVQFEGPKPYDDVEARMARARIFINTSDSEGFPNTYLQAWTRGVPVVARFDPDGVIERFGLGRAVRTEEQMRQAIRELLSDAAAWRSASARCRQYVAERHGENAVRAFVDTLGSLECAA